MMTTVQVCRAAQVSYRQLDYWDRQGALTPAVGARGSGSQRMYTPRQAQIAYVLGLLSDLGAGTGLMERVSDLLETIPSFSGRLVCDPDGYVEVGGPLGLASWTIDLDLVADAMAAVLPAPVLTG